MTRQRATDNDEELIRFVLSYTQYYGEMPTLQETGRILGYTRQNSWKKFRRLVKLGVLEKTGHGEYKVSDIIPMRFDRLAMTSTGDYFKKKYILGQPGKSE